MSDARQTRYDRRRRSCRTNSEFDSIRGEYRFFECRKTGSQTESKNRFIRFFPYRYTTLAFNSSRIELNACDISGFRLASVRLRNSVPYLCFTSRCSSGWMSFSHWRTIIFPNDGDISSFEEGSSRWLSYTNRCPRRKPSSVGRSPRDSRPVLI